MHIEKQTCFYEYFVPDCREYLTYNINLNANLANETLVRAFFIIWSKPSWKQNKFDTNWWHCIDLQTPPIAINVELYPDFPSDDLSTTEYKKWKNTNGNIDQSQVIGKYCSNWHITVK